MRELLEGHAGGVTLEDLALVMRVSPRSVRRYLHDLRDQLELEPVPSRSGGPTLWRIRPQERGRAVAVRRTQAYLLLAARRAFEPLRGSALFDELDVAYRLLLQVAQRPVRSTQTGDIASEGRLEDRLLLWPSVTRSYAEKGGEIDDVFRAVAELRVLDLTLDGGESLTCHPYALLLHQGRVLCLAHDVAAKELRIVPVEHIAETRIRALAFKLPADFDADALFRSALGPVAREDVRRALVEFDAAVADEIRGRKFHPAQRIAFAKDGRARLSLPVADEATFLRWILGFGARARVIEPPELATRVREELTAASRRYR